MRTVTPAGTESTDGAKLRMLVTPALTSRSAASWAADGGVAMTPIEILLRRPRSGRARRAARTRDAADDGVDLGGVDVDDAGHRKAALVEAAVAGERLAEVAGADDHDRPVVVEPELAADLVDEVVDLVADAARAVAAEVREVLAHLGGVDAGQLGEAVGRDVVDAELGLLDEDLEVHREPGDGGLGDPATAMGGHRPSSLDRYVHDFTNWQAGVAPHEPITVPRARGGGACRSMLRGSSSTNSTLLGALVAGEVVGAVVDHRVLVELDPRLEHDVGLHRLTGVGMGHADHGDLGDAGMRGDHVLDLGRVDVEARHDDQVLGPVDEVEVAVVVDGGDVAGAQPAVGASTRAVASGSFQ